MGTHAHTRAQSHEGGRLEKCHQHTVTWQPGDNQSQASLWPHLSAPDSCWAREPAPAASGRTRVRKRQRGAGEAERQRPAPPWPACFGDLLPPCPSQLPPQPPTSGTTVPDPKGLDWHPGTDRFLVGDLGKITLEFQFPYVSVGNNDTRASQNEYGNHLRQHG